MPDLDLDLDPVQTEIRDALRRELTAGPAWPALVRLSVPAYELPPEAGGFGLGLPAALVAWEELGRHLAETPLADGMRAADGLLAADRMRTAEGTAAGVSDRLAAIAAGGLRVAAVTGAVFDVLPGGAVAVTGKWTLTTRADVLLVTGPATPADDRPAAVLVDRPPGDAVELSGRRVEGADVLPTLPTVRARLRQAAYLVGLAAAAHQRTVRRTLHRRAFDRRLFDFQDVAFRLAAFHTEVTAARLLTHRAAALIEVGADASGPAVEALATAAELALALTREAVHLSGAHGLTTGSDVQRYYLAAARHATLLGPPALLWREAGEHRASGGPDLTDLTC